MKDSKLFTIYNFFLWCLTPVIFVYLGWRLWKGKEDKKRFNERLAIDKLPKRDKEKIIWVHVASVGEAISSFKLIERLCQITEDPMFLVTSGTVTSARLIGSKFNNNLRIIHQFIPIDHEITVRRFLSHWKPYMAIWFESELWPNFIRFTSRKCPILLLNSRMSDKSFERWKSYRFFISKILEKFSSIYPQSSPDFEKYKLLGARNLKFIGNLKLSTDIKVESLEDHLIQELQEKKIILAASTHDGEERGIIEAFNSLKSNFNNLTLIIAPRHPSRVPQITKILEDSNNEYSIRTLKVENNIKEVYIVDTIGELIKFYNIADVIFIGGSMINRGGHNPLEAAKLGKHIFVGPYMQNFTEIVKNLTEYKCLSTIHTWQEFSIEAKNRLEKGLSLKENENLANILNKEGERILEEYITEIKGIYDRPA